MIDLEKEFGFFLDALEKHLDSEELFHYGVKGMRWGVRKERQPVPELKGLGPQRITTKTASGHEISISQDPPNSLQKFLGRHSAKYRSEFGKGAFLTIKDKDSNKVGDAIVEKRSKDELYLLWLGIKKKERGKGYATAVMKAAEEFGKKEGFKKLTLEVPGNAKDAAHIYSKLGFKITKQAVTTNDIWGGLTEMEYTFSDNKIKHADLASNQQVVIVAIPKEDDYVWKISSEKVPHMTLLLLGETQPEKLVHIAEYIQHATSQISRFGMSVDRRGKLGPNEADVLFFDKGISNKLLDSFRSNLLKDQDIFAAYNSTTQYPEWIPHLTLGYPETPAKPDKRDYGFHWVNFDRIALWTSDSEGPTFQLKSHDYDDLEVSMSEVPFGTDLDDVLSHYGVKGMKWGKRKTRQTEPTHSDSEQVGNIKSRVKTQKTTKILSNEEIRAAIDRMRIEQEFSKLSGGIDKTRVQKGKQFIGKLLVDTGKQNVEQTVKNQSQSFINEALKNVAKK